ncbi:hypothetical protein C1645_740109 [Glomus cerebriforme]|uniref:Uncharacterized protein n=1 Tax=Glomus cerebriforme TaxID=658196 RepID=A0A397SMY6_9GLOM|nr:hypothetical protein C1645_740109 [Glomus cerebriforme]
MSQSSDISVKIDEIDVEIDDEKNIATDIKKNDKPHNGKPITMIEVSPNGTYLVTYSPEDNSFIGWNVTNVDDVADMDEFQLKPDDYHHTTEYSTYTYKICVSDDKKLTFFPVVLLV